ncbi:MAG: ABC transporter permease [Flavobacteriales bacterium]|nr:ABC transporter permease [Flavobacteriales bacterium]
MIKYIFNKLLYSLLVLFGVVTIIFFLFNVMPADPAKMMLGNRDNAKQLELLNSKYHFDKPIHKQYFYYLKDLSPLSIHCNSPIYPSYLSFPLTDNCYLVLKWPYLRTSFYQKNILVSQLIYNAFLNTLVLSITAIIFSLIFGIPLGILAALFKDRFLDKFISFFSILGMSLPSFLAAVLIGYIFAYKLHWLTNLDITGSLFIVSDIGNGQELSLKNLILPTLTLGIRPIGVIVNLTRTALIDELNADYIYLVRSKGFNMRYVVLKHALQNSLSSIVTAASGWFAGMLSGAVFIEYIFGWNGLGKLLVDGLISMDFPLVMGVILVIATCFIIINILVDLIYLWLDPRVEIN